MATWRSLFFPSGTTIVISDDHNSPHFYIYGPVAVGEKDDEGEYPDSDQIRYKMCHELALWLNGDSRPKWLDDMYREHPTRLVGVDGSSIEAVGPTTEREDRSDKAIEKRSELITLICEKP